MIESISFLLMYAYPIRTLCQEIMCNARDAHIEVGKRDLPIEVILPSEADLHIRFRDFGPGISPDRMVGVFLLYGSSTKRDSNEQVGGFGLGAVDRERGQAAKKRFAELVLYQWVTLRVHKDPEKYGRWLARVFVQSPTDKTIVDVSQILVVDGHVKVKRP